MRVSMNVAQHIRRPDPGHPRTELGELRRQGPLTRLLLRQSFARACEFGLELGRLVFLVALDLLHRRSSVLDGLESRLGPGRDFPQQCRAGGQEGGDGGDGIRRARCADEGQHHAQRRADGEHPGDRDHPAAVAAAHEVNQTTCTEDEIASLDGSGHELHGRVRHDRDADLLDLALVGL